MQLIRPDTATASCRVGFLVGLWLLSAVTTLPTLVDTMPLPSSMQKNLVQTQRLKIQSLLVDCDPIALRNLVLSPQQYLFYKYDEHINRNEK